MSKQQNTLQWVKAAQQLLTEIEPYLKEKADAEEQFYAQEGYVTGYDEKPQQLYEQLKDLLEETPIQAAAPAIQEIGKDWEAAFQVWVDETWSANSPDYFQRMGANNAKAWIKENVLQQLAHHQPSPVVSQEDVSQWETYKEIRRSLECLYVGIHKSIADDILNKFEAFANDAQNRLAGVPSVAKFTPSAPVSAEEVVKPPHKCTPVEKINCPLCGNELPLSVEDNVLKVKGKEVNTPCFGYRCEKCKEDFTTTESDTFTIELAKHLAAAHPQPSAPVVSAEEVLRRHTREAGFGGMSNWYEKVITEAMKEYAARFTPESNTS